MPDFNNCYGGEGGVRTLARLHVCWFSKPVPSASWVLLQTLPVDYSIKIYVGGF